MKNLVLKSADTGADMMCDMALPNRQIVKQVGDVNQSTGLDKIPRIAWGVEAFDRKYGGLIANGINMLSVPDHDSAIVAVGHFLAHGINQDQCTAIVTFDNPAMTLSRLSLYGFDFDAALHTERLVYLYYKPTFLHVLSCSTDYGNLFNEILKLSGPITRLAFLDADMLFDLQTEYLARVSASKLAMGFYHESVTTLGCFVRQDLRSNMLLDAVARNHMSSYIEIHRDINSTNENYHFKWLKGAATHVTAGCNFELKIGQGYVVCDAD